MSFRITGLSPAPFAFLFGLNDAALAAHGVTRYIADKPHGFPDRIELRDASVGESLLLVNYVHQPADTPYRASHAIFVREGAQHAFNEVDHVPAALRTRPLSLRAFDEHGMMVGAELIDGGALEPAVDRLLGGSQAAYLQAHFAVRGCYACRIERA